MVRDLPVPKPNAVEIHPASAGPGVTYLALGRHVPGWPADRIRVTSDDAVEIDVNPASPAAGLADGQPVPIAPALALYHADRYRSGPLTWCWRAHRYALPWQQVLAYVEAAVTRRLPMERGGLLYLPYGALHGQHHPAVGLTW